MVASVVETAKGEGTLLNFGFDAAGQLQPCVDILKEFVGSNSASLASAKPLSDNHPKGEGVHVKFVAAPTEAKHNSEFFYSVMECGCRRDWVPESTYRARRFRWSQEA